MSFYGPPGEDLSRQLIDALLNSNELRLGSKAARLHFVNNDLQLLTIGAQVAEELLENRRAGGLFQNAALQGNTFGAQSNLFASGLLSFDGNSFVAEPRDGRTPYGAMIANRAAAAGNVAVRFGDEAILFFLVPPDGGFSGAANQVFILPQQ